MLLVTGASGLVGGETARLLMAMDQNPRVLLRNENAARDPSWQRAHPVVGDFDRPETLTEALDGAEAVLLVSPSTPDMVRQQSNLVDAAAKVSSRHRPIRIVKISGFMTSPNSSSTSGRWHAAIEAKIDACRLPSTCLRPPFFMQNLLRQVPPPIQSGVLDAPQPTARIAMVDARDIAAVAARCLLDDAHDGQRFLITGPQAVSYPDLAVLLSEASGRPVCHMPLDPRIASARMAEAGVPAWRIEVVQEFQAGFEAGAGATVSCAVRDITGDSPRSLRAFIHDHLQAFGA